MKILSIGEASTLGNYLKLCRVFFGEDSAPTKYMLEKVAEQGEDMEVVTDESQMMWMFQMMLSREEK